MSQVGIDEYQKLTEQIHDTIKNQDDLFQQMKGSDFVSQRKQYQISNKIEDLESHRNKIWSFLKNKYNENTNLRKKYFEKINENKKQLKQQQDELEHLTNKLNDLQGTSTTSEQNIKRARYEKKRHIYYSHLYNVLIISQVILVCVLYMGYINVISRNTSTITVILGIVIVLIYIIYYVYFMNYNRNKFDWDAYYFGEPTLDRNDKCVPYVSEEEKEVKKLEKLADAKLKDFIKPKCEKTA